MGERGKYKTRQRGLVEECLAAHAGAYLTVDGVLGCIKAEGQSIGRTTVYRALEDMADAGRSIKVSVPGGETSYRIAEKGAAGQLVCLECGSVLPLDCRTAADLAQHVMQHHGFSADASRTVLYGTCAACMKALGEG
ncbi:MAG TPA: transcriptional repressor [Eggerthellaceae bacterium]|nr:transcriptional repressor [Eggerthellaceae bacterium]